MKILWATKTVHEKIKPGTTVPQVQINTTKTITLTRTHQITPQVNFLISKFPRIRPLPPISIHYKSTVELIRKIAQITRPQTTPRASRAETLSPYH